MSPKDIELVRSSFAKAAPITDQAAAMFYDRLFELDPSLKSLFQGDLVARGKRLMAMTATAVQRLTDLDTLVPVVRDLGPASPMRWRGHQSLRHGRIGLARHAAKRPGRRRHPRNQTSLDDDPWRAFDDHDRGGRICPGAKINRRGGVARSRSR